MCKKSSLAPHAEQHYDIVEPKHDSLLPHQAGVRTQSNRGRGFAGRGRGRPIRSDWAIIPKYWFIWVVRTVATAAGKRFLDTLPAAARLTAPRRSRYFRMSTSVGLHLRAWLAQGSGQGSRQGRLAKPAIGGE
jgi:hypothetical protein